MKSASKTRILLNVGCGQNRPAGWINTDCSLNSLAQGFPLIRAAWRRLVKSQVYDSPARYMNLNRRWCFKTGEVDAVHASHVFEHLSPSKADLFLEEAHRVLAPDGALRVVVPDLYQLTKAYIAGYEAGKPEATKEYLWALNLHLENSCPPQTSTGRRFVHRWQGYPHQHKYMYDLPTLKAKLAEHAFHDLGVCTYGVSDYIPEIRDVECTGEGVPAIYVEGRK